MPYWLRIIDTKIYPSGGISLPTDTGLNYQMSHLIQLLGIVVGDS